MKLRLRENSIRLRLLQSEIEQLRNNRCVSEKIQFANSKSLTYTIVVSDAAEEISAGFEDGEITVEIPLERATEWLETNRVGLENERKVDGNAALEITLEKDFVCLDRPLDADNADAFPHPKLNRGEK